MSKKNIRGMYQLYFTAQGSIEVEADTEAEAKKKAEKIIREGQDGYIYADYDSIDIEVQDVDVLVDEE